MIVPGSQARLVGGHMKMKLIFAIASCFFVSALAVSPIAVAQEQQRQRGAAAGGGRGFPQPAPAKDVTTSEIPGVIAGGPKWNLPWHGPDNADGLVAAPAAGVTFAPE